MLSGRQSFTGIRRRAAMWLIAAWAVFSVSQALAACCAPSGGLFNASTGSAMSSHMHDAGAQDDCCDTPVQPCALMLDEAPPPAPLAAGLLLQDYSPSPVGLIAQVSLSLPPSAYSDGRMLVPIAQAPPAPIYLRFQRFLI